MSVLEPKVNPRSEEFKVNAAAMRALVDDLNVQLARMTEGGGAEARAKHVARGKLLPRERVERLLDPDTPFLEIAPLAGMGVYLEKDGSDAAPSAGVVAGIGPCQWRRVHDRLQRRHGEGRQLLPPHGQEAPARAGDRCAKPPALRLPGRLRRRQPAYAGRGLPRPRPLRPHLLQPGQPERRWHSPGGGGDGLVHRRWRLRAGDERRDHHRQEPGHHFPGRPAAGEGSHRRGGERRGPGRRRHPHATVRRGRPPGRERPARAGVGASGGRPAELAQAAADAAAAAATAEVRGRRAARHRSQPIPANPTTCARSSPASSTAASSTSSRRATAPRWCVASPTSRACPWASSPTTASCLRRAPTRARTSSSCAASAKCRSSSCRTSPASWSGESTRTKASPAPAPRWSPR
jgi:hypothetical protein